MSQQSARVHVTFASFIFEVGVKYPQLGCPPYKPLWELILTMIRYMCSEVTKVQLNHPIRTSFWCKLLLELAWDQSLSSLSVNPSCCVSRGPLRTAQSADTQAGRFLTSSSSVFFISSSSYSSFFSVSYSSHSFFFFSFVLSFICSSRRFLTSSPPSSGI